MAVMSVVMVVGVRRTLAVHIHSGTNHRITTTKKYKKTNPATYLQCGCTKKGFL